MKTINKCVLFPNDILCSDLNLLLRMTHPDNQLLIPTFKLNELFPSILHEKEMVCVVFEGNEQLQFCDGLIQEVV